MSDISSLTIWEKFNTKIFINFGTSQSPDWARLGKSTVFDLVMNPETEAFNFIEDETPTELIKNYKPTMAQETMLAEGDGAFDALFNMYMSRPVGSNAVKGALIVYPKAGTAQGSFAAMKGEATIAFKNFNTVDRKLVFDMMFSGLVNGDATITLGVPSFSAYA